MHRWLWFENSTRDSDSSLLHLPPTAVLWVRLTSGNIMTIVWYRCHISHTSQLLWNLGQDHLSMPEDWWRSYWGSYGWVEFWWMSWVLVDVLSSIQTTKDCQCVYMYGVGDHDSRQATIIHTGHWWPNSWVYAQMGLDRPVCKPCQPWSQLLLLHGV